MAMHTETLTTSWYQLTDLDDPLFTMLVIEGDDAEVTIDAAEPVTGAATFTLPEGIWRIDIPQGKYLWAKSAGTTDIVFSKFGGLLLNFTDCAYAFSSNGEVETGFVGATDVTVGSDDLTVRDETLPYGFYGFLKTVVAGIANSETIASAILQLRFVNAVPGVEFRVRGAFGNLTSYEDIAGLTTTTASVVFDAPFESTINLDVTSILQELVDDSGWDDTFPIRFTILATTAADGTNELATISRTGTYVIVSI